jgi:hypothetical protein
MRLLRALLFVLGVASPLAAAPSFTASLTAADRERLGLSALSPAQLAALDAAVAAFHAAPPAAREVGASVASAPLAPRVAPAVQTQPAPAAPAAARAVRPGGTEAERFTARVVGEFRGWSGGTYFPLENGQVWRQVGSESNELPPSRGAVVEIYPSGSGYWRLRYEGAWITVRRLQ